MLQFSKSLGLLLFVCGSPSAQAEQPADVVAAIQRIGGTVRPVSSRSEGWVVEFQIRGQKLTDKGLANVAALKDVVSLNLRDTQITSAGLVHLKGMVSLQRLHLERTQVDDQGIAHLVGLVNLEYLNLYKTNVTDKALTALTRLKKLKRLYIWQTRITARGATTLGKALPALRIVRGVDLTKLPSKEVLKPRKKAVALKWIAATGKKLPRSKLGINITLTFENKSKRKIKIYWISYGGQRKLYGRLDPGGTRRQNTYAEATWLITDENDIPMGSFRTGTAAESLAVIPAGK